MCSNDFKDLTCILNNIDIFGSIPAVDVKIKLILYLKLYLIIIYFFKPQYGFY